MKSLHIVTAVTLLIASASLQAMEKKRTIDQIGEIAEPQEAKRERPHQAVIDLQKEVAALGAKHDAFAAAMYAKMAGLEVLLQRSLAQQARPAARPAAPQAQPATLAQIASLGAPGTVEAPRAVSFAKPAAPQLKAAPDSKVDLVLEANAAAERKDYPGVLRIAHILSTQYDEDPVAKSVGWFYLGKCHFNGWGTEKNHQRASTYFNQVLELNNNPKAIALSRLHLAICYAANQGLPKDYHKAFALMQACTHDQQYFNCSQKTAILLCLGDCYRRGLGVAKDHAIAVKAFTKVLELDCGDVQKTLAQKALDMLAENPSRDGHDDDATDIDLIQLQ